MKPGRKEGENQNPRDQRGWMIPKEGTIRRKVYDLMVMGFTPQHICEELHMSKVLFAVNRHYIQNADRVNARQLKHKRWQQEREQGAPL